MDSKLNQDWIRYEQVEKRQSYHLAEDAREEFDDEFEVRTCDMRKPTFAQDLGEALHEIGFAILEGHGVDPALYDEAEERIVEMFERLTLERDFTGDDLRRRLQQAQYRHAGDRLAGTGLADDREHLADRDIDADIEHRRGGTTARVEHHAQIIHLEKRPAYGLHVAN